MMETTVINNRSKNWLGASFLTLLVSALLMLSSNQLQAKPLTEVKNVGNGVVEKILKNGLKQVSCLY